MQPVGLALSSEEHQPIELVRQALLGEVAGFEYALVSDHFHPWTDSQGQSPFVWSVVGAIAQATGNLRLGTGVTCPTIRTHPAIIAHAAHQHVVDTRGVDRSTGVGEGTEEALLVEACVA